MSKRMTDQEFDARIKELEEAKLKIRNYRGWVLRTMEKFWFGPGDPKTRIAGLKFHYSIGGTSLCGVSMFYTEDNFSFFVKSVHHRVHPLIKTGIRKHRRIVCKKCLQALERALREGKRGN